MFLFKGTAFYSSPLRYLLIKLINNPSGPFEVQVPDLGRSIDICQLDTHLTHQQSVILIGPIDSWTVHIIHLLTKKRCRLIF